MPEPEVFKESPEYSLVLGGPLFQLFRRTHLSGDALELINRRLLVIPLLTWLPLLVLAWLHGQALGDGVRVSFLFDIETHVRSLIAAPVLIATELIVHRQIRPVVQQLTVRRMIIDEQVAKFHAAMAAPLLPLTLTVISAAELLQKLIKILL